MRKKGLKDKIRGAGKGNRKLGGIREKKRDSKFLKVLR